LELSQLADGHVLDLDAVVVASRAPENGSSRVDVKLPLIVRGACCRFAAGAVGRLEAVLGGAEGVVVLAGARA
jgi:hypothetical protein